MLVQLYKCPVRSQLDYGSPIYNQANKHTLSLLDPIQALSSRLALEALCTSVARSKFPIVPHRPEKIPHFPNLSVCAEAAEPPLHFRRLYLTSNFLTSLSQCPSQLTFEFLIDLNPSTLSLSSSKHIRFLVLQQPLNNTLELDVLKPILTSTPTWLLTQPSIRLDLTEGSKTN